MKAFDFESQAIESRPNYPPEPVGLAINGKYISWGHPAGNNCATSMKAESVLDNRWTEDLLCHNAAFDLSIAIEKWDQPVPEGRQIHDTMIMAFLLDPYGELSLKPLAERYLGMPPTERDAVRDWLYANKVIAKNVKRWGAHIAKAPGNLVGPYAVGDIERTEKLYKHFVPKLKEAGMWPAYRRECEIMPMLLDNSALGIPLDSRRLKLDTAAYSEKLIDIEKQLRKRWKQDIGGTAPANFDSNDELADAIERGGLKLALTATGKRSVAKDSLLDALPDCPVKGLLLYRSAIEKAVSTYMRPWAGQGQTLQCNWNQIRDYEDAGARTGRLSSSPNLQNMTNVEKYDQLAAQMIAWGVPKAFISFPNIRSYIQAPRGYMLFSRDYSQQELRMLAHYEDGALAEGFRNDPDLDVHEYVRALIKEQTGMDIPRKHVKNINFAKIYGAGIPKLSAQMGVDTEAGTRMVYAYEDALPSVKELQDELKSTGRRGEYITTLGGRRYYTEPAKKGEDGERPRTFEYKLLNYLVQGGSADQTKEAMRLWWSDLRASSDTRFLLTVHDQLVGMAPKAKVKKACDVLGECMASAFTLSVPMKSDATYGVNFGEMGK